MQSFYDAHEQNNLFEIDAKICRLNKLISSHHLTTDCVSRTYTHTHTLTLMLVLLGFD